MEEPATDSMHLHTACLRGVEVAAAFRILTPLQHATVGLTASPVTKERQGRRSRIAVAQEMAPAATPLLPLEMRMLTLELSIL